MGAGINSGKVAAGLIGTNERLEYTVIGDAVNLAEKAEAANKIYGTEILVLDSAVKEAGEDYIVEAMPGSVKLSALINARSESETKRLMAEMEILPDIRMSIARHFAGPEGPQTLRELRVLLGISEPDFSRVKADVRERKFNVQKS